MNDLPRIVIVGAGIAGLCSAERLRELGFDGEIVIIGSESTLPVYRPSLSKQFLTGELGAKDVLTAPADDLGLIWRLSTTVSQLDPQRRIVHLPGGEELEYDGLVIASGVESRRHPGGLSGHPRAAVIRTRADTRRLRQLLDGSREQIVVIGTGFIGCEVASSLRHMDRPVTLVGRASMLMNNLLDTDLATRLTDLHRRNKVRLELGTKVETWAGNASRIDVRLSSGRSLSAAAVIVAVGSIPAVAWLRDSGATLNNGVVCDATCHVEGMEDVVAAGDVASWPNLRFETTPRRVEHWTNAIEMGRAAAESLLSGRESASPFTPIPRFWSEQHGLRIQAAGMPAVGSQRVSLDPAATTQRSLSGYLSNDELVGVIGFDRSVAVLNYAKELQNKALVTRVIKERSPSCG
ncbi:NAD(P)/FAD-dependent oxidoreductase [Kribbella antibiotica]|uniref:NAD(P)/FAD-dependent oxidoreductase n=1 Tax=Kribbella antibiotica TaxID=190195 RepID=A0A4R4ZRQ8_9ACTN|nr:FAD-dependent oxidoreductase [Kribbella antibiotica]TDD61455.1 NAD(P)/FAD-dependent oxidoreductase [Kribbella antibiotica]